MVLGGVECGPKRGPCLRPRRVTRTGRSSRASYSRRWLTRASGRWRAKALEDGERRDVALRQQAGVCPCSPASRAGDPSGSTCTRRRRAFRAQAVNPDGSPVDDFAFAETRRAVHVLNAPSPGLPRPWRSPMESSACSNRTWTEGRKDLKRAETCPCDQKAFPAPGRESA